MLMRSRPILLTDGKYVFAHTEQGVVGPFNLNGDDDFNREDPYGCPFNPKECVGGVIHHVANPMVVPPELKR